MLLQFYHVPTEKKRCFSHDFRFWFSHGKIPWKNPMVMAQSSPVLPEGHISGPTEVDRPVDGEPNGEIREIGEIGGPVPKKMWLVEMIDE